MVAVGPAEAGDQLALLGVRARPFLKWAGGKAKLAPTVLRRVPGRFVRYHEPFLGAGAVFFALRGQGAQAATLTDVNANLIETFKVVRDDPKGLWQALAELTGPYLRASATDRAALYYAIRASVPASPAGRSARLIFLNRTCFNGLYRENRSGQFNVPHGRYERPGFPEERSLRACSEALQGVDLRCDDFDAACAEAGAGDFVYLDPPYHPISPTASFTSYSGGAFAYPEQLRLRDAFDSLAHRGVATILSNSDHPAIRELYEGRGYRLETMSMSRAINSVGTKRAPIPELLISNFG